MNLGAPLMRAVLLELTIYEKMPAKTIRHNAFQQIHIFSCNPTEQLFVGVKPLGFFGRIFGQICYEDCGSCF